MKVKIFVADSVMLGFKDCFLLDKQTYCFPFRMPGVGLFKSRKAVSLVEGFEGAWGELWEVDLAALERVAVHYESRGNKPRVSYLDAMQPVTMWLAPLKILRGTKATRIDCFRNARR